MRHSTCTTAKASAISALLSFAASAATASAPAGASRDVDSRPRHLAPGICHLVRTHQLHTRGAAADEGWRDEGAPEVRVWLDGGPVPCTTPPHSVHLQQSMPAPDIISLLQQQATLLQGARLLFAGNTSCARARAYHFTLAAMQPAPAERGAQAMYQLTYASDRHTSARVTIRKHRGEFTAWNVDCALP